ncbi:LytR/AlgR family response regulator transcription factor [Dyadobacter fermentans]|uniref:Two component transcriptional regulator, LytTR family n=1 Tax=Dyadobacter fermentans (strain ATCC 700827 / DSM 18053 / CIP 107007 / KCTC 52180 / NS114) TaxID=471854 RepID=C6W0B3_DYAFD|nr:LytTR family DNA-binding domain-containing protein [Dyadobacter fermentans]ACT91847.1 two component transcriptional regulator, LytTR family [Dyadobacter fermentans DSM 18053]
MAVLNPIRCFIVDDEIQAVHNLRLALEAHCPQVEVAGYAHNVHEAHEFLARRQTDILFLDIRLQNETGFDLLKRLNGYQGSIIFTTAYDLYGIQAIKFSATDYLLKPLDHRELAEAVGKATDRKKERDQSAQIAMLVQSFESLPMQKQKKIALAEASEIHYVLIDDIIFCKSDNSYTTFHLTGSRKITVSKPISEYEVILEPYGFLRTHQSYLINKNRIVSFKKEDGGYLMMEGNFQAVVSKQRRHLLKELFL